MILRTLATLRPAERRALAAALPLVAAVRLALWVLPSRRIVRAVGRLHAARVPVARAAVEPEVVAWAVAAAGRVVPGATCLTQAVAARLLLARWGHAAELCVGVGREGGAFRAHAWVEHGGRVVIGGGASRSLARLPVGAR